MRAALLALTLALGFAPVASADDGGGAAAAARDGGAGGPSASAPARTVRQLQGRVVEKDPAGGKLKIRLFDGKVVSVHGTPQQLGDFSPDTEASIEVTRFGNARWLVQHPGAVMRGPSGTVSLTVGQVRAVDVDSGALTLEAGGRTEHLRAHPQDLRDLKPGQFVNVIYGTVKKAKWVEDIEPSPAREAPAPRRSAGDGGG